MMIGSSLISHLIQYSSSFKDESATVPLSLALLCVSFLSIRSVVFSSLPCSEADCYGLNSPGSSAPCCFQVGTTGDVSRKSVSSTARTLVMRPYPHPSFPSLTAFGNFLFSYCFIARAGYGFLLMLAPGLFIMFPSSLTTLLSLYIFLSLICLDKPFRGCHQFPPEANKQRALSFFQSSSFTSGHR